MGIRVELRGVSYIYPGSKSRALKNVSITLRNGMCYGVTGPNGSGKTTLLKIISLLYKPTDGHVLYNGTDPWGGDITSYRKRVVYVHEKPVMVRGSVLDNLALGLRIRGYNGDQIKERIERIAVKLDLSPLLDRNARDLSAGQRQLVAIARALVLDPDVIALDEPYSNIDFRKRKRLSRVVNELRGKGKLVVISSHDIGLLVSLCDYIIYLENGEIVLEGPAGEVYRELLSEH
ncbi:MAG: energy-coupling factor ABC transporter ATP-binding protein [Desulfurococcales archaeon]|nr:energy-coupling factor ABC transporter ATP-binding protein [Desulfurococcales archaeon]